MKSKLFAVSDSINGTQLKATRKKLKLTQAEFARLANVSVKTVERWESGKKPVTGPIVTLIKVLKEFPQIPRRAGNQDYRLGRLWGVYQ